MTVVAIVPAAGRGDRFGGAVPKVLCPLGGVPILCHTVTGLFASRYVDAVVVAAPQQRLAEVCRLLESQPRPVTVLAGGPSRQASVAAAVAALPADAQIVLVHDGARPLVPVSVVDTVVEEVWGGAPAVAPLLSVVDSLKQVDDGGRVVATVPREALCVVQTPQGFRRDVLERAHAAESHADREVDDITLVERLGVPVRTIPGAADAMKITWPPDLPMAEAILSSRGVARS